MQVAAVSITSDVELLRASDVDPAAFRELYDRYAGSIHRFCLARTSDHDAALDLTAEAFAQAGQSRAKVVDQHSGSLGPWLFGIARNVLLRSVRDRRMIDEARSRLQVEREHVRIEPLEIWLDGLDSDLDAAVAALPSEQRRAVELHVLHDLPYQHIAADLGCSQGAARIRVSRGLAAIRRTLEPTTSTEE